MNGLNRKYLMDISAALDNIQRYYVYVKQYVSK